VRVLEYLNTIGANIDALDKKGDSLLHKAASNAQYNTVKWLLDHGLNPQIENNNVGYLSMCLHAIVPLIRDIHLLN
jgi:ankyrin repeat protein